ncbi:hypothetical protein TGARI_209095 [Toxoplasma gondii ARI]|uniref:Uncharacterized protein n=1 Tax=Toxoplasma gondii ARI TaxID=1074872 RepID=A0A139XRA2_TOXGO|nr:hypothetical protein TGARI_209095 [Toxoplasma gondii ARI]
MPARSSEEERTKEKGDKEDRKKERGGRRGESLANMRRQAGGWVRQSLWGGEEEANDLVKLLLESLTGLSRLPEGRTPSSDSPGLREERSAKYVSQERGAETPLRLVSCLRASSLIKPPPNLTNLRAGLAQDIIFTAAAPPARLTALEVDFVDLTKEQPRLIQDRRT